MERNDSRVAPLGYVQAVIEALGVGLELGADLGDFGRTDPTAIVDTVGVDPEYGHQGVGHALFSQLFLNLAALRIERVETVVAPRDLGLLGFLYDDQTQPPDAKPTEIVYVVPDDADDDARRLHVELPGGNTVTVKDKAVEVVMGSTRLKIEADGAITLEAGGDITLKAQGAVSIEGSTGATLKGATVSVTVTDSTNNCHVTSCSLL